MHVSRVSAFSPVYDFERHFSSVVLEDSADFHNAPVYTRVVDSVPVSRSQPVSVFIYRPLPSTTKGGTQVIKTEALMCVKNDRRREGRASVASRVNVYKCADHSMGSARLSLRPSATLQAACVHL
jgi:hypothetical protein